MPIEARTCARRWTRFLCNHNPLYLVSVWLVLHGIRQAFQGEAGLSWIPLITQLLCAYIILLTLSGWLVVRVGKVWEDARMILLVVLLMFTALSTSYDNLCLKEPLTGAKHLGIGFAFCCAITELIVFSLRIKLPLRYRLPFYLQLAVLFAFPAWLGKLSVDGRDPAMCLGVLAFPLAAAAAMLTLLPAASAAPDRERPNGTPWPWPYFPWSIFVFVAIASGIRAWMLSLSFTPAAGVAPAFLPYFLSPILLAMLVLALEMGLHRRSIAAQRFSLLAMIGVIGLSFPGEHLNRAQLLTLNLLEESLAAPPFIVCGCVALLALLAMFRRAAGGELISIISLGLLACLDSEARSLSDLHAPNSVMLLALAAWQLGVGLWSKTTLRMAVGGLALLVSMGQLGDAPWLFENNACWACLIGMIWCAVLPLYCVDKVAIWLRELGPMLIALSTTTVVVFGPSLWMPAPSWPFALSATAFMLISLLYWLRLRAQWYMPAAIWSAALATVPWTSSILNLLQDAQLRRGLTWYAVGCNVLIVALITSLWKAGVIRRMWRRLQHAAAQTEKNEPNIPERLF